MANNRLENWRSVWERKGKEAQSLNLRELINLDGFDKGAGKMSVELWLSVALTVGRELDLKKGDFLLEVGCGSGAMLLPFHLRGIKVAGIDYSRSLIEVAKRAVPGIEAKVSEAKKIPFKETMFSKILSFSVFQYFPDFDYATKVLLEMKRILKAEGKILIMDIPDVSKKIESEHQRSQALLEQEGTTYPEENGSYSHLYYPKSFFADFAKTQGMSIKIFDQDIPGYGNSPFRFNVLLWR